MNTYRIRYKTGGGIKDRTKTVRADKVDGFKDEDDTYVFWRVRTTVLVVPKSNVVDIEIINEETSEI